MKSYLIASSKKSSGKTVISTGLSSVIKDIDKSLSIFKKGPDYIDPLWLSKAAKTNCYNLDFYTMTNAEISKLYKSVTIKSNISLIEGNKGLFDGMSLDGSDSNAALAKLLKSEVLLVIDCSGITRGIAPLLSGYENFDKKIKYKGVILNKIASDRHEGKIINAIHEYTNLDVIGSVHKNTKLDIMEQQLGLEPTFLNNSTNKVIKSISSVIKSSVDIDRLIKRNIKNKKTDKTIIKLTRKRFCDLKIGIAKDNAFGFYYADDIEKLKSYGVQIKYFNTLKDKSLPKVDGVLIGGGFPENVADKLSKNISMKKSVKSFIDSNMPIYVECGGLMYLSKSIKYNSKTYKMVGAINGEVNMLKRPVGRGYVDILTSKNHPWMKSNLLIKAHEFHYSKIQLDDKYSYAYQVKRGYGINNKADGVIHKNLLASYIHIRDTQKSRWIKNFLTFIMDNKIKNETKTNI